MKSNSIQHSTIVRLIYYRPFDGLGLELELVPVVVCGRRVVVV